MDPDGNRLQLLCIPHPQVYTVHGNACLSCIPVGKGSSWKSQTARQEEHRDKCPAVWDF